MKKTLLSLSAGSLLFFPVAGFAADAAISTDARYELLETVDCSEKNLEEIGQCIADKIRIWQEIFKRFAQKQRQEAREWRRENPPSGLKPGERQALLVFLEGQKEERDAFIGRMRDELNALEELRKSLQGNASSITDRREQRRLERQSNRPGTCADVPVEERSGLCAKLNTELKNIKPSRRALRKEANDRILMRQQKRLEEQSETEGE